MPRIIAVAGGKGGVGKTTLVSNLSAALADLGYEVLALDANVTTPNLGVHLGFTLAPHTLHNVLRGDVSLKHATYPHVAGFRVMPASIGIGQLESVDITKLSDVIAKVPEKTDFVLMDSAAGLGREAVSSINAAEDLLLITNPDIPSVADALKTVKVAEKLGKNVIGIVVNRVKGLSHEIPKDRIEEMIGRPVIAEIPEDVNVGRSLLTRNPIVFNDPHSPASVEFRKLAHFLAERPFEYKNPKSFRVMERLVNWMVG